MRCIRCGKRNKSEPESFGHRCPDCGHRVAASVKRDGFADGAVQAAIDSLASGGHRFLPEHVGYEMIRRGVNKAQKLNKWGPIGAVLLVVAVVVGGWPGVVCGAIAAACLGRWITRHAKVPGAAFRAVNRFLEINRAPQIIEQGTPLTPGEAERELACSARQILVCQFECYAEYLLANAVHLDLACPVVGPEPQHSTLFPGVVERLQSLPGARVFVLHDMTSSGMEFAARIRTQWFADRDITVVVDLGLKPGQEALCAGVCRPLKDIRGGGGKALGSVLKADQGVELTALRPQRLLEGLAHSLPLAVPLAVLADTAAADANRGDSGG